MTSASSTNVGARLDRLPLGSFHWRIFGLMGAGMFLDAFDLFLAGGILGLFVKTGFSTVQMNANFVFSTFIGLVVGAWLAGVLGDRYGRRFCYQFNLAIFGLASLAACFAPSMNVLIVLRFIMGIGLGAEIVVGYATLAEFVPPGPRGSLAGLLGICTNASNPAALLLGYLIIPTLGWQYMFAIVGIGAILVWLLRQSMPESPRWLESKGRYEEADRIVSAIEAEIAKKHVLPEPKMIAAPPQKEMGYSLLFKYPLLRHTIVGMLIWVSTAFVTFGFFQWLPTFFVKEGFSVTKGIGYAALMAIGSPIGAGLAGFIADKWGRKKTMVVSAVLTVILGSLYPFIGTESLLVLVGFVLFIVAQILQQTGVSIYIPEGYPTEIRFRGAGTCSTVGRFVTAITQYLVVFLFGIGGVTAVVAGVVIFVAILAVVIAWIGIETRQKPLEEISMVAAPIT